MSSPTGFGYKIAWLAIRSEDAQAVADALGLDGARAASWDEGVSAAYAARLSPVPTVFVTPPVDGWVLAVLGGGGLFDDDGTGAGLLDLATLSRRFGEAQRFSTHRVVEAHEWQRWADGLPVRRYRWIGETGRIVFDDGEPGPSEGNPLRWADLDTDDWEDLRIPGEDTVMTVAAGWSIDPTGLGVRTDLPESGLLGHLPASPRDPRALRRPGRRLFGCRWKSGGRRQ